MMRAASAGAAVEARFGGAGGWSGPARAADLSSLSVMAEGFLSST